MTSNAGAGIVVGNLGEPAIDNAGDVMGNFGNSGVVTGNAGAGIVIGKFGKHLGACLPAPVSEKIALSASSPPPISLGI